jgi:hypothetical protein
MLLFSREISHADHDTWSNRSNEHDSRRKDEKVLRIRYRRCWKLTISSFHRFESDRDVFDRIKDNECCKEKKKCLSKNDSYHKTALKKEKTRLCRQLIIRNLAKHAKNDHQRLIRSQRDESIEKSDRSSIE